MRILFYGESPFHPTGFGQVDMHLLRALSRAADVICVASSHYYEGEYDRSIFPYDIVGCSDLEEPRNLAAITQHIQAGAWDIFFYQGDIGANNDVLDLVRKQTEVHPEKMSIFYMPIDCDVANTGAFLQWRWATVPVVYTYHGKNVVARYMPDLAEKMSVIWLGCETEQFYPLSTEEKRAARLEIFGEWALDRYLVLNLNRNQQRKDLARCMAAFHQFHEQHPDSTLYMHSVQRDHGGWLPLQANIVGCDIVKQPPEIAFSGLDLAQAWPRESLNKLYNACDVLISTSYGEGWGLATTEAMCAGLPVLVPQNTANLDIIGPDEERGWFIQTGGDLDHTIFLYGDQGGSPHDIIHTDSFLSQLDYIYSHRAEAAQKAAIARAWCVENSWQRRESEWEQLIWALKEHLLRELPGKMAAI